MRQLAIIFMVMLFTISPVSACSSVVSQDSFGFQRDSTENATISIVNNGNSIVESKPGFTHSIVYSDGTAMGKGGNDNSVCDFVITYITNFAHWSGIPSFVYMAAPFTWASKGHYVYKYDSNVIILCFVGGIYVNDASLVQGEYMVVPNGVSYINSYMGNNSFDALNQSTFGNVTHHRYAIEYNNNNFVIQNFMNESITI